MRGGVHVVEEPRLGPDCGPDAECAVLPSDEDLDVVVDDGLGQRRKLGPAACVKEDGVPAEAFGHPGHGRLGSRSGTCDLPVRGAGGESRGDGDEKYGALEVVGRGERLPGARASAVTASEARDASDVARSPVRAKALEASSWRSMGDAFGPGAKRWKEAGGTHRFRGQSWPAHEGSKEQGPCQSEASRTGGFVVRRESGSSAVGRYGRLENQQARGHRACGGVGAAIIVSATMSSANPFISIVVPIRNEEATIERLTRSLLDQDYPHDRYEILMADGGSTDRTRELLSASDVP